MMIDRFATRQPLTRGIGWILILVLCCGCAAIPHPTTQPSPIAYRHETRTDPKQHLHIVTVDLTDPRVELIASPGGELAKDAPEPWQMTLQTVRAIARQHQLDVAVNANFFMARGFMNVAGRRVPYFPGNPAAANGWFVSDGRVISSRRGPASLVVTRDGRVMIGKFDALPEDAYQAVSGSEILLADGKILTRGQTRVPRTVAGISGDGRTLVLLVVDGRLLSHSVGMSETEAAEEMLRLGCSDAINLDGGGSSTLVLRDPDTGSYKVRNRPSDGHDLRFPLSLERPVANAFGVRLNHGAGAPATGPADP